MTELQPIRRKPETRTFTRRQVVIGGLAGGASLLLGGFVLGRDENDGSRTNAQAASPEATPSATPKVNVRRTVTAEATSTSTATSTATATPEGTVDSDTSFTTTLPDGRMAVCDPGEDGVLDLQKECILVEDGADVTPSASPTGEATETVEASATPTAEASATPTATATAEPTATPTPEATATVYDNSEREVIRESFQANDAPTSIDQYDIVIGDVESPLFDETGFPLPANGYTGRVILNQSTDDVELRFTNGGTVIRRKTAPSEKDLQNALLQDLTPQQLTEVQLLIIEEDGLVTERIIARDEAKSFTLE